MTFMRATWLIGSDTSDRSCAQDKVGYIKFKQDCNVSEYLNPERARNNNYALSSRNSKMSRLPQWRGTAMLVWVENPHFDCGENCPAKASARPNIMIFSSVSSEALTDCYMVIRFRNSLPISRCENTSLLQLTRSPRVMVQLQKLGFNPVPCPETSTAFPIKRSAQPNTIQIYALKTSWVMPEQKYTR